MVELLFPATLRQDMRDVIYTPYRSRLKGCSTLQNFTFPVVDVFIIRETRPPVNPLTPVQKLDRLGLSRMKDEF